MPPHEEISGAPEVSPRESLRKTLLRAAAQYSVGALVTLMASIARVGVTARVLSAEENGTWLALQLVLGYAANLHCGSLYGLYRSVPMLLGRGEVESAEREKRTAFTFSTIMSCVGAVVVPFVASRVAVTSAPRQIAAFFRRRRSRSERPPQIPNRSSCSSAYSRHSLRTSHPVQIFLASRVEPPFSGKNASGSVCAHSARSCHWSSSI